MADIKFTGNLGRESELTFTKSGRAVLNFSVADSKSRKLENGEWETTAEQWLNCAIWGELAEFYSDKLPKGARVTVYGDFMSRKYEAKDGTPGVSLDVTVKGLDIMPARNGGNGGGQRSGGQSGRGGFGGQQQDDPWGNGPDQEPPF